MNTELRDKLNAIAESKGWGIEDCTIIEMLTEGSSVKEYGRDEHRWYVMYLRVVKINDEFLVDFQDYTNTGDEPALDYGERVKMVLDSAVEVFPKEVTVTDYVTKDKL